MIRYMIHTLSDPCYVIIKLVNQKCFEEAVLCIVLIMMILMIMTMDEVDNDGLEPGERTKKYLKRTPFVKVDNDVNAVKHNDNDDGDNDGDDDDDDDDDDGEYNYMAEKKRKDPKASLCRAKSSILGTIDSSSRENTY